MFKIISMAISTDTNSNDISRDSYSNMAIYYHTTSTSIALQPYSCQNVTTGVNMDQLFACNTIKSGCITD